MKNTPQSALAAEARSARALGEPHTASGADSAPKVPETPKAAVAPSWPGNEEMVILRIFVLIRTLALVELGEATHQQLRMALAAVDSEASR